VQRRMIAVPTFHRIRPGGFFFCRPIHPKKQNKFIRIQTGGLGGEATT
jgi:hypothetical protein